VTLFLLALAGAVGAPSRYVIDVWLDDRFEGAFPWGTFAVNVVGSFLLGVIVGLDRSGHLSGRAYTALGAGFCGSFTTLSTHAVESVRLAEDGAGRLASLNVAGSLAGCLAVAAVGVALGELG
jgi:CrcB protein